MGSEPLDLAALIAPLSLQRFFEEDWETRPLVRHRGDEHFYDGLLTKEALERVISSADLRYPAIQLAKGGGYYPPEAYTRDVKHGTEVFTGVPDLAVVKAEYASGATIVLPALHRTYPPLHALCAALERYLDHAVHANAYVTPGSAVGFRPHYDTHDVLVLQVAGKKHWRVFEGPTSLPHRSQPFRPAAYTLPAEPLLEVDLAPGDLLYLPRGYVHTATTRDGFSAHVTIGITVYTWVELISELAFSSASAESFRRALPVGFASRLDAKSALRDAMRERLRELVDRCDYDQTIDTFSRRVAAGRAPSGEAFQVDVRANPTNESLPVFTMAPVVTTATS
jgi:lysine-specific demethylase/histidyl-hydroxylase NO66